MSFGQYNGAVLWSLALHVAVMAGILVGIPWPERPRMAVAAAPAPAPIQGIIIDQAAIEREQAVREEERQQQQREERQRRAAAEQRRVEQRREEQRVANEQLAREQAAQKERHRVAAEKAAEARRELDAKAEQERVAAEKRAREQAEQRRRQQQVENELQQQLALEAEQNAARAAGLYDQYVRAVEQRIKGKWQRPLSARLGLDCVVRVVQVPTGDVISASVVSCNGDDAVRRSIERAVLDASPLPKAPTPALFERTVEVRFQPEE